MGTAQDFDAFYSARFPSLVYALYLACGDWGRAEDAAQEAFVRAWHRWRLMRTDDPVAWVRRTGWRLCIDEHRRRSRDLKAIERLRREHHVDTGPPFGVGTAALEALTPLSLPLRSVAVLHYLEDLSVDQIASVLDVPSGTVKSRLSRARDALRQNLTEAPTTLSEKE